METTFLTTLAAVISLFLMSLAGYIMVRIRLLSKDALDDLSRLVLYISMPALVLYTLIDKFDMNELRDSMVMPLGSIVITVIAGVVAFIGTRILFVEPEKRPFVGALVMFGNSGYLPIPLVMSILPKQQAEEAVILIFFFILGFTPLMWSVGLYMIIHERGKSLTWKKLITPPLVGIVVGTALALIPSVKSFFKNDGYFFLKFFERLGDTLVPLVMILLGGVMATINIPRHHLKRTWITVGKVFFMRMLILPAVAMTILYFLPLPNMIRFILAIQAMVPPAVNLIVIARTFKRPTNLISLSQLGTYIMAIATLPVMIHIALKLFPLS